MPPKRLAALLCLSVLLPAGCLPGPGREPAGAEGAVTGAGAQPPPLAGRNPEGTASPRPARKWGAAAAASAGGPGPPGPATARPLGTPGAVRAEGGADSATPAGGGTVLLGPTERDPGAPLLVLRHNPARCGCPPFEVRLGSSWVRVFLEEDQSSREVPGVPDLQEPAARDQQADGLEHHAVAGEVLPGRSLCPNGHRHPILRVDALGPDLGMRVRASPRP